MCQTIEFILLLVILSYAVKLNRKTNNLMATQAQLKEQVDAVTLKINKVGVETANTLAKVKELQDLLAAGTDTVSPELQAAVDAAVAAAQAADDLTPDAPAPEPVPV